MTVGKREDNTYTPGELIEKLTFWCTQQPVGCTKSVKCFNIRSCKENPYCLTASLSATDNLFEKLIEEGKTSPKIFKNGLPGGKTVRNFVAEWKKGKRQKNLTKKLNELMKYLVEYEENPCKDNAKLNQYKANLNKYYKEWKIDEAIDEANKAISDFPYHPDIVRWWALLHNRAMKWSILREVLNKKRKHRNQDVIIESNLGLFESYLNELTPKIHEAAVFEQLETAKNKYLEPVNDIKEDGQYFYFKARYIEEEWLKYNPSTKTINTNILREGLENINKSIDLYEDNQTNKEKKNESPVPYWLYCHKCIFLKLLCDQNFPEALKHYEDIITTRFKEEFKKRPVQIYKITYLLLEESSTDDLKNFLVDLDRKISEQPFPEKTITVVENFTFHHVDLLFHDKPIKAEYLAVLNQWANKHRNNTKKN